MRSTLRCVDTTQLLKGVLDLAVLAALRDQDGYGYDILRRLRTAGLEDVGDASVYGTLRRLFNSGFLTTYVVPSDEGPHRKYYGLNAAIRDELLEDLPEHLAEVAADDVGSLADRLGPPSVYAAELLASAGFVGGFPDPPARTDRIA